jgi:hypothetical protein
MYIYIEYPRLCICQNLIYIFYVFSYRHHVVPVSRYVYSHYHDYHDHHDHHDHLDHLYYPHHYHYHEHPWWPTTHVGVRSRFTSIWTYKTNRRASPINDMLSQCKVVHMELKDTNIMGEVWVGYHVLHLGFVNWPHVQIMKKHIYKTIKAYELIFCCYSDLI